MCKRTGIAKRLLCLLIALVLILSLSVSKVYAVSVPMLPYVPPYDVQMFDMLFNAFGLTVPDIEDDAKRLEGYWKLFEAATIANVEATKQLIQNAFDKAKTSRVIELSPDDINAIRLVGKVALNDGVSYIQSYAETLEQTMYDKLMLWNRTQGRLTQQQWNMIAAAANQKFGRGQWTACAVFSQYRSDVNLIIGAYPKEYTMRRITGSVSFGGNQWSNVWTIVSGNTTYPCVSFSKFNTGEWQKISNEPWAIGTGNYFIGYGMTYDGINLGQSAGVASINAQNTAVSDAITQGTLIPITAATEIVNGVIDDTKPLRISLPNVLPLPAETVADLPAVQEQLGVVPISDDVTDTVDQLKQAVTESVGSASDYAIDLTQYFPFCLPFDVFRIIGALIAEPEAPKFSYTIVNPWTNDEEHNITLEVDLAMFDQVAEVLRTLESILFVVGLCVVTRSLYLRG